MSEDAAPTTGNGDTPSPTFADIEKRFVEPGSLVSDIIAIEWTLFTGVNAHTAPKASCQQDPVTFVIMRASQAETWTREVQESWLADLRVAQASGRNLMTEKYARMMESTNPVQYASFADRMPAIDEETLALIEDIVKVSVAWKADTMERFPKLSGRGRALYTKEDSTYSTSFETYLRGELRTYSPKTIRLYHEMVEEAERAGRNLEEETLGNTVSMYGMRSLEEAEARLS